MHRPLSILLTPDSFKGSLSAIEFCDIARQVIKQVHPDAHIVARPMSDGGEGFAESLIYAGVAEKRSLWVANPLGRRTKAIYAWQADTATAFIEMAQASGLPKIRPQERNPMQTHTYGTGQLIEAALKEGAEKVVLGLGGSATNDGGAAALQALGIPLLDSKDREIGLGGQSLQNLNRIGEIPSHLQRIEWQLACDVTNPLLGEHGATQVFGPQKGVNPHNQTALEKNLKHWADRIEAKTGQAVHDLPGAGAAGGMAAGFIGLLNAKPVSGFDLLNDALGIERLLQKTPFDYLVTGEGRIDAQTRYGKLPMRIAELGLKYQTPTIGVCGSLACSPSELPEFQALFSIINQPMLEMDALQNAPQLLQDTLFAIAKLLPAS